MSTNFRNSKEGYVEEPAAKDFLARKARIITLSRRTEQLRKLGNVIFLPRPF
jgi:hypothetical protein